MGKLKVFDVNKGDVTLDQDTIERIVWTNAGAPTNGTSGTLKGVAQPGDLLVDTTNKTLYQNTNTSASPTWSLVSLPSTGLRRDTVSNALTAAGTTRTDALALTSTINNVTTAGAGTGVTLPASAVGQAIVVFNGGANAIKVYGAGSDTIDGVAGSTGVTLTNAKRAIFYCVAANTYISGQLGVPSA